MVKLSVSKVARMLGIKRSEVQKQINLGKLQTHEGYVTTDSVRLAYPEFDFCSEQDNNIERVNKIKERAYHKTREYQRIHEENEQKLLDIIANLKDHIKELEAHIKKLEAH